MLFAGVQWNSRVCEESQKAPGNSKWLEFLYGTNKTNSKPTQPLSDNQPTNHIIKYPAVQLPPLYLNTNLSDIPKQPTGNIDVYNTEDLMEFEREKIIRRQPGQSEDPFYLTLTSNRDSFKGYKRPRIDPTISSSGSSVVNEMKDKLGGFLEESVFATPTDDSILRSDGMLTENPYSNSSGMRSIKDFIANKTLKYDQLHDALTDEEMEEIDSSAEDSENTQTTNNISTVVPTKSRFVVPFAIKEQSPIPLDIPKEEQKSYDRFLKSLVAPDAECGSGLISEAKSAEDANIPQSINEEIDSLMMPILKWKEKVIIDNKYSENSIESIPVECDECDKQVDKESTTNTSAGNSTTEHQCYEESIVRENSNTAEKSVIEAELNEKGIDVVEIDENSADLMSGNNTQDSSNELIGESFVVRLEDQNNITVEPKLNQIETINGSVEEIKIDHALGQSYNVKEISASPPGATQLETGSVIEETNERLTEVPEEINTIEPVEIATDETETNELELINNSQMEVDMIPEEIATCEPREEDESVVISNSINKSTNQDECTQESEQIVTPNNEMEYSDTNTDCIRKESSTICSTLDTGVQYSQQSQGKTAEDKGVDCTPATESKECQIILQVNDGECQTSSFVTDEECQTDFDYSEPIEKSRNIESREIQTEEEIVSKIEEKLTNQYTQTEEITHSNNGSQTDILLIRFPIEGKEQNNYEQNDYENFILYQQQIIKALQRELEMSNL